MRVRKKHSGRPVWAIEFAVAIALTLAMAAPADAAAPTAQRAAACLQDHPVCVDHRATNILSPAAEQELTRRIEHSGAGAVYVAVVPPEALKETKGSADVML